MLAGFTSQAAANTVISIGCCCLLHAGVCSVKMSVVALYWFDDPGCALSSMSRVQPVPSVLLGPQHCGTVFTVIYMQLQLLDAPLCIAFADCCLWRCWHSVTRWTERRPLVFCLVTFAWPSRHVRSLEPPTLDHGV